MKKFLKICSLLLCFTLVLSPLTACRREETETKIDATKTQLNIGGWPGAYGDGISPETIKRFEEKYKDVELEPGKKGVQVSIHNSANYKASVMTGNFQNYSEDIYILEESTYYDSIRDGQGDFAELTDVVNSSFRYDFVTKQTDETGEDLKFSDKLYQADLDWMNVGSSESPKYYAVPYRQEYAGIWYDVDMFNQRNWYFRTNEANSPFIASKNDAKSLGADGVAGTWDDGLPATYDQFITLCKRIREAGSAPVIWSGRYAGTYGNDFLRSLYSDYSGLDEMMTTLNFAGKHDIVTGFDGNTPIIEKQTLTYADAYKAHEQSAGKYYAMKFAEDLCKTTAGNGKNLYLKNSDFTHYQAQLQFMANKYDNNDDCAMLIAWGYWFYEAQSNVNALKEKYKLSDDDFNYALMPYPKATKDKIGEDTTVMCGDSILVISRYIAPEKLDLAKAFVQFIATEESLKEFFDTYTVMLKYKMDIDRNSDFYKNASTLGKSVLDASERMNFFTPLKSTDEYRRLAGSLAPRYNAFGGTAVFTEFTRSDVNRTAKELFEGMAGKYQSVFA